MTLSFRVMSVHLRLEDYSFLLWFGVSVCFLTLLAPPEAQESCNETCISDHI